MPYCETSDGERIWWESEGPPDAPPLLFSNSLGTNLAMWDGQVDEAAESYRVIRYDQRGHGRSAAPAGEYTLERLGRDVIELLDALGIVTTRFCGLSMGGMTGIWLLIHHPERFERAALCNTAAHMPPPEMWNERIRAVTEKGMGALVAGVTERWFTPAFRKENPQEVERIAAQIRATEPAGYAGCCAAIRDMDQRAALSRISKPSLVLIGDCDPATTPEQGELLLDNIAGAKKAVLHAAHLSNVEQPQRFNAAVLAFLR
ncbi:3-oxoadipate enol-lactonase [Afifella pfennigii]|uniref:3-oxoadipate enol-lactonase n=1 Tax=Afifella pfennigii TaxID=209897 RepID=UPI00047A7BB2|nr:3-oxoadipate enol-lactonase [Afifella pfennigii]